MAMQLTGLEGKVAVVTGAGRMRGIGRAIAVALAGAGCDVVVTGTGRDPASFPAAEQAAGWRDIDSRWRTRSRRWDAGRCRWSAP